jgi:hypothetical protein
MAISTQLKIIGMRRTGGIPVGTWLDSAERTPHCAGRKPGRCPATQIMPARTETATRRGPLRRDHRTDLTSPDANARAPVTCDPARHRSGRGFWCRSA